MVGFDLSLSEISRFLDISELFLIQKGPACQRTFSHSGHHMGIYQSCLESLLKPRSLVSALESL